jgi:hypothetical protein
MLTDWCGYTAGMEKSSSERYFRFQRRSKDLVYDLVSTSKESQYEKVDQQPAYMITFQDIESAELLHEH